ncbi:hypothetical protein LTR66_008558 [Elasticomyces elasticus]|nr:hypothetical protein LTR66_008558 [Elasticomyces elasticus]
MDGREIPGFYYDAEKKKYFKVVANHLAPQGAKYSHDGVKEERRRAKKRKLDEVTSSKRQVECVRRSRALLHPSAAGIALSRELGYHRRSETHGAQVAAFARRFQERCVLDISQENDNDPQTILDFDTRSEDGVLVLGTNAPTWNSSSMLSLFTQSYENCDLIEFLPSRITSVSLMQPPGCRIITTTEGTHDANSVMNYNSVHILGPTQLRLFSCELYNAGVHEPNTLLDAVACPFGDDDKIAAVGTEVSSVSGVSLSGPRSHEIETRGRKPRVCWLSRDTVVTGNESGEVILHDVRTLTEEIVDCETRTLYGLDRQGHDHENHIEYTAGLQGQHRSTPVITGPVANLNQVRARDAALRFLHPNPVAGLRPAGEHSRILVAGGPNMLLYDVRGALHNGRPQPGDGTPGAVLKFPCRNHLNDQQAVFDVSVPSSLVVARDDDNAVRLYSLLTGEVLRVLCEADAPWKRVWFRRLRCIESRDAGTTLMGCRGSRVLEWAFGGEADDEA